MAKFTVRVQLRDIKEDEDDIYDELHEAMRERGFSRTFTLSGVQYHLPHGEYSCSDGSKELVLRKAMRAIDHIGKSGEAGILVTKTNEPRAQHGLKPVLPRKR